MKQLEIDLPKGTQTDIGREIAKRACYCDQTILNCRLSTDADRLSLTLDNKADDAIVKERVERLIEQMKSQRLTVKPKIHRATHTKCSCFNDTVFEDLTRRGDLHTEGIGVVARGGEFQNLLTRLDQILTEIGTVHFGARERFYNSLIPANWLHKAGYFTSFPHSVTFAMHLGEDIDRIEKFAERHRQSDELRFESIEEISQPEFCLSPAVCYHTYGELSGLELDESDLTVITALGRCFRYESKNITDLDRLWEFSMREIIFVGSGDRVIESRNRAIELIWRLVEYLGLEARLETASDPFFATDFKSLRYFQLANDLKYELVLPTGNGKSIAAGSFNYHENFFGNRFNLSTSTGDEAHTGCAAFGMERMILACLSQLGLTKTTDLLHDIDFEIFNSQPAK